MSYLWKKIDTLNWGLRAKYHLILFTLAVLLAAAGFVVWEVIHHFCLNTFGWMICFMGYPALLSMVIVMVYSDRHPFHKGSVIPSSHPGRR